MTYEKALYISTSQGHFAEKPTGEQAKRLLHWANNLKHYEQGRSRLVSTDDKFCCLGAYCDLKAREGTGHWRSHDAGDAMETWKYVSDIAGEQPQECRLPSSLMEGLMTHGEQYVFTVMNDNLYLSFREIASFIKHWVKTGFKRKKTT